MSSFPFPLSIFPQSLVCSRKLSLKPKFFVPTISTTMKSVHKTFAIKPKPNLSESTDGGEDIKHLKAPKVIQDKAVQDFEKVLALAKTIIPSTIERGSHYESHANWSGYFHYAMEKHFGNGYTYFHVASAEDLRKDTVFLFEVPNNDALFGILCGYKSITLFLEEPGYTIVEKFHYTILSEVDEEKERKKEEEEKERKKKEEEEKEEKERKKKEEEKEEKERKKKKN